MTNGPALEIRGLHKRYAVNGESIDVLQDINLVVEPGAFVSIVGASGCGKSTLLRLIVGLEGDYEGQIRFGGAPIGGPGLDRGIVFQEHRLFPWLTVERNIGAALLNSPLTSGQRARTVAEHIDLVTHDVEEAVFLGDRVIVMDPRPGRIRREVDVPVAHPRARLDPALERVKHTVLAEFADTSDQDDPPTRGDETRLAQAA